MNGQPVGGTPETDAAQIDAQQNGDGSPWMVVEADFARDLERRLNDARAELERARSKVAQYRADFEMAAAKADGFQKEGMKLRADLAAVTEELAEERDRTGTIGLHEKIEQLERDLAAAREELGPLRELVGVDARAQSGLSDIHHWTKLMDGWDRSVRLAEEVKALTARTVEAERVLRSVEEWWLRDGMKHSLGAPECIFAVREFLSKPDTKAT